MESFALKFGELLKNARENMGLSRDDLADMVKLTRQTIRNIELGKHNIALIYALNIAKVLRVDFEEVQKLYDQELGSTK